MHVLQSIRVHVHSEDARLTMLDHGIDGVNPYPSGPLGIRMLSDLVVDTSDITEEMRTPGNIILGVHSNQDNRARAREALEDVFAWLLPDTLRKHANHILILHCRSREYTMKASLCINMQ